MHDKPLLKSVGELLRRRHGPARAAGRSGQEGFALDSAMVSDFIAGTLGSQDEERLAGDVAEMLPHHWDLPTKSVEALTPLMDHFGSQQKLMAWLDDHPGRPRLTARIYVLLGHLDQYSEDHAVLAAVRHARAQDPYPDGLRGYLTPDTNDATLGGLASRIEELLGDNREKDATALALATADWLRRAAQNAEAPDADVREMGELMGHMHQDISEAAPST
ncbi:hypothetical protein ACFV06_01935 [Streptomyces sp. NPDC059618]|uniref:hypothetical protein n=1 Tax=Streptomyces sp. NPDC059618 TaxID=3346887 RepID=UPI00369A400A